MNERDIPMDTDVDTDAPYWPGSPSKVKPRSDQVVGNLLKSELRCAKRYKVTDPIGYAVLTGNLCAPGKEDAFPYIDTDLKLMEKTLGDCGWKTHTSRETNEITFDHRTFEATVAKLRDSRELYEYSCFLFYYTGHGTLENIVSGSGDRVSYLEVIRSFSCLPALKETYKPKIFVFDTCRDPEEWASEFEIKGGDSCGRVLCWYDTETKETNNCQFPDTIVCFAASGGQVSSALSLSGSVYTMTLAHAIRQHKDKLSFSQIVTLAQGGTVLISRALQQCHLPEHRSTLTRLLYLTCTDQGAGTVGSTTAASHSAYLEGGPVIPLARGGDQRVETKGPYPLKPLLYGRHHGGMDVVADRGGRKKRRFRTKKEVVEHLSELGEGVGVFVCYAPDPESPYLDPETRTEEIDRAESYVFQLVGDLERHGFSVTTDLHVRCTQDHPCNWLKWYSNRITDSDHVIVVCSPAFKELFTRERPQGKIIDERALLLFQYSRVIYGELQREIDNRTKFIPVFLDPLFTSDDDCVPSLFASQPYRLFEDKLPRQFNYDNRDTAFEKLVCRMAEIDRAVIDAPKPVGVQPITGDRGVSAMAVDHQQRYLQYLSRPRKGYKTVPSKYTQAPVPQLTAPVPQPGAPYYSTAPVPQPGAPYYPTAPVPQPTAPYYPTASQTVNARVPPVGYQLQGVQPVFRPQPSAQPQLFTSPLGAHAPSQHPLPLSQQAQAQPPNSEDQPDTGMLPEKAPHRSVLLWLSNHLVKWKFFARYLDLEDHDIDRIEMENRDNLREQCYQMFRTCGQLKGRDFTYQSLGRVILESERNRRLYTGFVDKVREVEESSTEH